jgi:hypothetical protein
MIEDLMSKYFGRLGNFYLLREMKELGFESLKYLSDDEKMRLCDALENNVFSKIMSRQKTYMIRSEILRELSVSQKRFSEISSRTKNLYDLTRNVV